MLIEEEEPKSIGEVNPDALEAIFEDESTGDEESIVLFEEEEADEIDIAFLANDEGYW